MAERGRTGRRGLFGGRSSARGSEAELRRLEEKHRSLAEATEKWRVLLRELVRSEETDEARYQRYLQAYIEARKVEKRAELELFNARHGLIG